MVKTFYATDRLSTGRVGTKVTFGGARGTLTYGICEVSIPNDHEIGALEAPSIWRLEFKEDPEKHVVVLTTAARQKQPFFTEIAARVRASRTKNAFVFVHGYNVTFEDAARRTAQIAYDLKFDGAPVFYSWPSRAETALYMIDSQTMEWAEHDMTVFLRQFFAESTAENIYFVAHSMGNRGLTRALAKVLEDTTLRSRVAEVILTAPDIDADVFKRSIAPGLVAAGRPITLYASSEDKALIASKTFNGAPRLGDAGPNLVLIPGIETIDATGVDTSFLGHSHFATSSVLADMLDMYALRLRAEKRKQLQIRQTPDGRYWVFKK